jgi:DNA-binding NarL/FixJ family response regulator
MSDDNPDQKSYKVICVSIYSKDLDDLDNKVKELKRRGWARPTRSHLIREAVKQLDINQLRPENDPTLTEVDLEDPSHPLAALTPREREVMTGLVMGKKNAMIAQEFGISVKTVDTHRGNLLRRLGLEGNVDLVRFALKHGLMPEDGFLPES